MHGDAEAVNAVSGTKVAAHWQALVPGGGEVVLDLRLTTTVPGDLDPFADFDEVLALRQAEADEFYASIIPASLDEDRTMVMRQALAGMLWTKQHYYFDLDTWLREHSAHPFRSPTRFGVRNQQWSHMVNDDVISMPDKWEYPWYAAWDLAFHTVPLAMIDPEFAREQLALMLSSTYLHPSGQIPAYEWNFGDVNPPVHAAALALVYGLGLRTPDGPEAPPEPRLGAGELAFLAEAFNMLLVNFTWWVNRKDPSGKNLFQGGFLGLDNIGVFDRSAQLPGGGTLEQSDGTAWMAFFSQSMLELALALAEHDPAYEDFIVKFLHALVPDRVRHGPTRRQRGRDVGRGGRVLLRRAPDARRHRPADQGAVTRRAAAPLRHRGAAGALAAAVPPHHRAAPRLLRAQR